MADVSYLLDNKKKTAMDILAQASKTAAANADQQRQEANKKQMELQKEITQKIETTKRRRSNRPKEDIVQDVLTEKPVQEQLGIPIEKKEPVTVEQLGLKDRLKEITYRPTVVQPDYKVQPTKTQQLYSDIKATVQNVPAVYENKVKPAVSNTVENTLKAVGYSGGGKQEVTLPSGYRGTESTITPYSARMSEQKIQYTQEAKAQLPVVGNKATVNAFPTRSEVAKAAPTILEYVAVGAAMEAAPIIATGYGGYNILKSKEQFDKAQSRGEQYSAVAQGVFGALLVTGGLKGQLGKKELFTVKPSIPPAEVAAEQIGLNAGVNEPLYLFKYKAVQ